jgi:restriction endonuclease S subunit
MKGWVTKKLGEVCDIKHGFAFKSEFFANEGEFVVLTPGNYYEAGGYRDRGEKQKYYTGEIPSEYIMKEGDMLVVMTEQAAGLLGSPLLVPESGKFLHNQRLGLVIPKPGIPWCSEFFFHLFNTESVRKAIHDSASGVKVRHTSPTKIGEVEVSFPPLAEQQRIVGLLDEAFEGLATAKANAEKNLQNARALFESHLQSVFTQRGPGWVEKTVKQIAAPAKGSIRTGPFGSQLLHSEFVDEGIAVLGIDNAVANEFRWGKSRFITPEKYRQLERYTVHPGDVLITIMGTCGRCAIVPDDIPTAINTKHICCITLDRKQCLPSYLHIYFLHAPQSQEFLAKHAKGAIMAGLNMGLIQELPVMLPPIKVQAAIVEAADDLREETQRLARLYERKHAALEALKKSLLHQAFAGEL